MLKLKSLANILGSLIILTLVVVAISCTPSTATQKSEKPATETAVITVTPTVAEPGATISFAGTKFKPGEEVDVFMVIYPPIKQLLGTGKAEGKPLIADADGSFKLPGQLAPPNPGNYPVSVYNKLKELRATCTLEVKAASKK